MTSPPATGRYHTESRTGFTGEASVRSDPYQGLLNLGTIAGKASVDLSYTLKASALFEATDLEDSSSSCDGHCVNAGVTTRSASSSAWRPAAALTCSAPPPCPSPSPVAAR